VAKRLSNAGDDEQRRILNRLRRLAGQVRGLLAMVQGHKPCDDILTQLMAAKSALNQVGLRVIAHTVKTCGPEQRGPDELVSDALTRFLAYARPTADLVSAQPAEIVSSDAEPAAVAVPLLEALLDRVSQLESLVAADAPCEEALSTVMGAKSLLDRVSLHVIAHAMRSCLAPRPDATRDEVVDAAMDTFLRYISCVS
jgi:DNA-binding FrmR family transcriptional regulator